MTKIYNCLWFAFIVKSLWNIVNNIILKLSGIFHHMYNYLLFIHTFSTCNTIPHIICAYTKFHLCFAFMLCTSDYFKPVFVCIQYDFASITCCFMTCLKALILNISFFNPLQIHLMSLYSSIPFFVIQILFMTCVHTCSSLPHYIFQES